MSRIFNFLKKKDPIFGKIRENFGNVQIIQKIIQNYSVVSLVRRSERGGAEWSGAWADASPTWKKHPEVAADLGQGGGEKVADGRFFMPADSFLEIFSSIQVRSGKIRAPDVALRFFQPYDQTSSGSFSAGSTPFFPSTNDSFCIFSIYKVVYLWTPQN